MGAVTTTAATTIEAAKTTTATTTTTTTATIWISRVFHFSLGTFAEVEHLQGPLETLDKTFTLSKFDISGCNETMQNALASIV